MSIFHTFLERTFKKVKEENLHISHFSGSRLRQNLKKNVHISHFQAPDLVRFKKRPYFTLFQTPDLENFQKKWTRKSSIFHTFLERAFKKVKESNVHISHFQVPDLVRLKQNVHISHFFDSRLREFSKKVDEKIVYISHFFQALDLGRISKK